MNIDLRIERLSEIAPTGFFLAIRMGFFFPVFERKTLPAKWIERYTTRGYMVSDPVMHWSYQNTGYVRWSDIDSPDPMHVMENARNHGLNFGAAVCVTDPKEGGQRSFASFARTDREFTENELLELHDTVQDLHIEMVPPTNLTDAELEALRMVKNGMLMKEIANLLGVTEGAVKQRLKNAKLKLDAKTSTHAAAKATHFGLI